MAEERSNTTFILDDDDTSSGGFNDFPEIQAVDPGKTLELDKDEADEVPSDAPADEPAAPAPADEEKKPDETPAVDPAEQRWNETIAVLVKKDEQISVLVDQVRALTDKVVKPVEEVQKKPPPEKPRFTAQDWEDDYEACDAAMYKYYRESEDFESWQKSELAKIENEEKTSTIQAIHQKDYADECAELPALTDPKIQKVFANIYYDPANKFNAKPDGVFRAVKELKRQAKERNIDLSTFGQAPAEPEQTKETAPDPAKVAADESARKARVATGTMHTGGKQSTDGAAPSLTPAQLDVARKFGINPETYAKTLAAMPGRKK